MKKKSFKKKIKTRINDVKELSGFSDDREREKYIDPDFVKLTAPKSGIAFNNEKYVLTGTGAEACIYVYGYKKEIDYHWLYKLVNIQNSITTIDIGTTNASVIKKNLSKTMEEQQARYVTARNSAEQLDAEKRYREAESTYNEVSYNNVIRTILVRIYVPRRTLVDCDKAVGDIIADLEGDGYSVGICMNETKEDFRNAFLSYTQQQKTFYGRAGQSILATTLAIGNPFHFSSLSDPEGFYYGTTTTGGTVIYDHFRITPGRNSYNSIIIGNMGSGKSTLLKKEMTDRVIRGDYVRVFDVTGEFRKLTERLGGSIISLSGGSDGKINTLHVLDTADSDSDSYQAHISKVATTYKYLKPDATTSELLVLKKLLKLLYIQTGIINSKGKLVRPLSEYKSTDFPTWRDLLDLCHQNMIGDIVTAEKIDVELEAEEKNVAERLLSTELHQTCIQNIELQIYDLVEQYGDIFDGHTSIQDFSKEQIVVFDVSNLVKMESTIFDAQIFQALSLCYDSCLKIGKVQKELYENKQIAWEDITRFLILFDEAHRIVNAQKLTGVKYVTNFSREMRKYFGAIDLASQSIRDFVPDGSSADGINQLKTLFDLSTYKWVLNQDSNCKDKLAKVFDGTFTESEIAEMSKLVKGEAFLSLGNESTIRVNIDVSDQELSLFAGGA